MSLYLLTLVMLAVITAISGLGLNLQWGLAGLTNFGLFGFYMLGAYVAAQLTVALGVDPWPAMAAAIAASAAASALVCLISLRLDGDYLAIVTLGFAECLKLAAIHEDWLTRGSLGVANIPRPVGGGDAGMAVCGTLLLLAVLAVFQVVARSPLGRAARATRDDPVVAATLGKNVLAIRLKVFTLGGAAIGLAGALHAYYYRYIDPAQFGSIITAYAFMVVILGGRASNAGAVLAAAALVALLEGSRFLNDHFQFLGAQKIAAARLMAIGATLLVMLIFRPGGFLGEFRQSLSRLLPDWGRKDGGSPGGAAEGPEGASEEPGGAPRVS
jgi:branched-chain amino acid transport system permease protein